MQLPRQTDRVLDDLREELYNQFDNWGHVDHPLALWVTIIAEELGEVSREVLDFKSCVTDRQRLYTETIQVAVAAIAMAEQVRRM